MIDFKLIESLTNAPGVSGNDGAVRKLIRAGIAKHVDDIRVDALGNLIAYKKPRGNKKGPKVLLAAHMDEIGLMVTFIDKLGYLKFGKVGGVDNRVLLAKRVLVGKDKVPGVIGVRPIHLIWRKGEHKKVSTPEELVIDIGASNQEDAQKYVSIGDYVVFDTQYEDWGALIKAKAFDDRIGCYLMMELLKDRYDFPVYAAFTTQEEVGLRGATTAAFGVSPDVGIAVDITGAFDTPDEKPKLPAVLGKGAAIKVKDGGMLATPSVKQLMVATAKANKIPYQLDILEGGTTDGAAIYKTRSGIPTGVISVPTRYAHSPSEMVDMIDVQASVDLLVKLLELDLKKKLP